MRLFRTGRRALIRAVRSTLLSIRAADAREQARLGDLAMFGLYFSDDAETGSAISTVLARCEEALQEGGE